MFYNTQEIAHGKKILVNAGFIWGWESPAGKKRAQRRAKYYIDFGNISRNTRVLELGCGTGIFTEKIGMTGADITAVDISPDLIGEAKQRNSLSNVSFMVMDIEKMNFKDCTFDAVFGSSVLHHLNIHAALREIKRVLKPGRRAVFTEPNMMNPQILLQKNIKPLGRLLGDVSSETAFFRWKLRSVILGSGFKKVVVEPFDFLHPWTPSFLVGIVNKAGLITEKIPIIKEIAGSLVITMEK